MKIKTIVVGLIGIFLAFYSHGQVSDTLNTDTIPLSQQPHDTVPSRQDFPQRIADSLRDSGRIDTARTKQVFDTVAPGQQTGISDSLFRRKLKDTIRVVVRDTVVVTQRDTITRYMLDVSTPRPETKMDSALSYLLKHAVQDTSTLLADTTRKMFHRFLHYAKSHPVDSTIDFMEGFMLPDTATRFIADTNQQAMNDSLNQYLDYIWQKTYRDSIEFTLHNRSGDSIHLWLTKSPQDSSRFLLYDDKDYPAGVWIHPRNKKSIRLSFVDEVRIEEVTTQQTLREYLPISLNEVGLQKQEEINMVFPQWDIDGLGKAHFNQGYLSNWARGGESSLSTLWTLRYSADYKKGKTIWDNDLEYKIGLLKSGEKRIRKNEDKLEVNSKFGSNAIKNWYYSTLLNFQTQFFTGYNYSGQNERTAISGFLAPSYLVFSIGMDYKPSNKLTVLLSPISSKFTMMRDTARFDQTNFGIPKNQKTKKELGAYVKSIFKIDFSEKINMENKVNLFINYLGKREALDIDYEMTLNMQVNRLITTNINAHLVYDRDVSKKIQFKENLSVGMQYKF